jgi:hypothetical protein
MGFTLQDDSNSQQYPGAQCDQILTDSIGGTVNDYAPGRGGNTSFKTAGAFEINAATALTLNGMQGGRNGRILKIVNTGAASITIASEAAGSEAANRFNFAATIAAGGMLVLQYWSTLARWTDRAAAARAPGA